MRSRIKPNIPSGRDIDVVPTAHGRALQQEEVIGCGGPTTRQIASVQVLPTPVPRVASVDALRGFSMLAILGADIVAKSIEQMLVHAGTLFAALGAMIGTQFSHAQWNGANT